MPPDPSIPFTFNPDGTFNLCGETFYGVANKLNATFDSLTPDPATLAIIDKVPPDLWEIDPSTGVATHIAPTSLNLGALVEVEGKFYAFHLVPTGFNAFGPETITQIEAFDLANGGTSFVRNVDPAAEHSETDKSTSTKCPTRYVQPTARSAVRGD
jgi:hypothetical protein